MDISALEYLRLSKEMGNRGFTLRCLVIAAVLVILSIKIYLLLFVMDFVLGLYSFFSSFLLLNVLTFAYFRYRDPYITAQSKNSGITSEKPPLFSIVVPVKNEEENIRNCVESCLNQPYQNKEIIVVNDGSTDSTGQILDAIRRENSQMKNFYILHLSKSVGKKKAVEAASQIAKGDVYAFMDSDCDMGKDALKIAAKIFMADKQLGGLTGHVLVRNASKGNIFEKMQSVYNDASCRSFKGAESTFASVTCCSGALSFYRRESVQDFIHEWAHDRFLGMDFKFCTDRRMTAHVLTTGPRGFQGTYHNDDKYVGKGPISRAVTIMGSNTNRLAHDEEIQKDYKTSSSPLAYSDVSEYEYHNSGSPLSSFLAPSRSSESSSKSTGRYWNVEYSYSIKVHVGVPNTLESLIKQQVRWKKSFIRSLSTTGGHYWKRPAYIALLYYITTAMKFVRPYVVFYAVFMLPFAGDLYSSLLWFAGIIFTSMIYGLDYKIRNPKSKLWLYRPAFTLLTTFVYTWLLPVAMLNIRSKSWR
jgi:hyaluronan synthase